MSKLQRVIVIVIIGHLTKTVHYKLAKIDIPRLAKVILDVVIFAKLNYS